MRVCAFWYSPPRRHRAHSTLTQTQNFISHIHCIHHGGWRCNNLPCRPPSLLRPTSDAVGPSTMLERPTVLPPPRKRRYQAVLEALLTVTHLSPKLNQEHLPSPNHPLILLRTILAMMMAVIICSIPTFLIKWIQVTRRTRRKTITKLQTTEHFPPLLNNKTTSTITPNRPPLSPVRRPVTCPPAFPQPRIAVASLLPRLLPKTLHSRLPFP